MQHSSSSYPSGIGHPLTHLRGSILIQYQDYLSHEQQNNPPLHGRNHCPKTETLNESKGKWKEGEEGHMARHNHYDDCVHHNKLKFM